RHAAVKRILFECVLKAYRVTLPEILQKLYRCCNGAEIFITDIAKNISSDGTQFATEYRRARLG
ncbi:MAG: hypothetical protein J6S24_11095, partial [Lentisphaeria bacterium]|nr:hypothetical protein [Lentisphaeria bacterium]